mmetsp:Transcript_7313/g.15654  ORF Transcript_7313/g.15654 Transcript_7313/m.15654 type:complete len:223 (-) Transcript_7313:407-1075(-)
MIAFGAALGIFLLQNTVTAFVSPSTSCSAGISQCLETAAFTEHVKDRSSLPREFSTRRFAALDDDDEDDDDGPAAQEYAPPTTVPDADLTAGEVVLLVLTALKNNDNPYVNKGVEILFGYSSPGSQIKQEEGLTPAEYGEFLKETEYKALFEHLEATIEKGEYSFEGKKGFFTARLQTGPAPSDCISVNFILSGSSPDDDDGAWLIDSILIRPRSVRRRRRR